MAEEYIQNARPRRMDGGGAKELAALLTHEYSFFRRVESGSLDLVYAFNFRATLRTRRSGISHRFAPDSYAAARLTLEASSERSGSLPKRIRKLYRNPSQFFEESRHPALRWIGRRLLP